MPGWGRSDRPDPARFDYSMYGLSAFLERCLDELGVERRKLVVHDWGALALIGAQRRPELVERLVVINAVPLLPGYRWHWIAQIWRRRPLGELAQRDHDPVLDGAAACARPAATAAPMPPEFVDMIWHHWDEGTGRAILALYRHADPDRLAAAGKDLGRLDLPGAGPLGRPRPLPADPVRRRPTPTRCPNAELELVPGAGHWPWIDDPGVVDRVLGFLA